MTASLKQSSLRDQVLAILRTKMITGEYSPGALLSASAVADELGVSSSPAREAMLTLVSQGVLEPLRNRGFKVIELSVQDRQDIHQLRFLLEVPTTVDLAGDPALPRLEDGLRRLATEIVISAGAGDLVGFLAADLSFHLMLLELSGNRRLVALVELLRTQTRQEGLQPLVGTPELLAIAEQHQHLLDALLRGDRDSVQSIMITHLAHVRADAGLAADETGAAVFPNSSS